MKSLWSSVVGAYLLILSYTTAQSPIHGASDSLHSHHHSDADLDAVQCHNAVYKINENSGKPEIVSGEESRPDPARQYLPLPDPLKPAIPPNQEKDPAASFNQPNFLSVENTFVSPSLQKTYNSLFSKPTDPEPSPAAAQNVATNTFISPPPKANKEKLSDDEKYSLDRLCKDAFHSFLCKPIKGPRKTPNGRIRPNAVIPPDVIAGLSSFQDVTRVKPDPPTTQSSTTTIPYNPKPSNAYPQKFSIPNQPSSKTVHTTRPPTTFYPTTSKNKLDPPDFPSPSNTNNQFLKPQSSNEFGSAQTNGYFYENPVYPSPSQTANPSNQNPQFGYQRPSTTPRPTTTQGYSYDRPNVPFPSNNVPQIALPSHSINSKSHLPHFCEKHKSIELSVEAKPSNDNPSFVKPFSTSTQKPLFTPKQTYNNPLSSFITNGFPRTSLFPHTTTAKPSTTENCNKQNPLYSSLFGNPTNQNPIVLRPENPKKIFNFNDNLPKFTSPPLTTQNHKKEEECDKHKPIYNPITDSPTNQNSQFNTPFNYKPLSAFPSNTFPRFQALPKTTINPAQECDKHNSPYNPIFGSPSNESPSSIMPNDKTTNSPFHVKFFSRVSSFNKPTTKPEDECDKKKSYNYPELSAPSNQQTTILNPNNQPKQSNIPKIPLPSNNIAQILDELQETKPTTLADSQRGYVYDKPAIPFPLPEGYPSDGTPLLTEKPTPRPFTFQTTTSKPDGYIYDHPKIPFASNNVAQILAQPSKVTTSTPRVPCEHENPSFLVLGKSSNQYSLFPKTSDTNIDKPAESASSTNQLPNGFIPLERSTPSTTTGFPNNKPVRPTGTFSSSKSNEFSFKPTQKPFPSAFKQLSYNLKPTFQQPFAGNIQSSISLASESKQILDAKPQNQVEVTVRPGYSYNKPETPFEESPTENGYSYNPPANPFIR